MYDITPVQMGLAFSLVAIPGLFSATLGFIGARVKLLFLLSVSFLLIGLGLLAPGLPAVINALFHIRIDLTIPMLAGCLLLLHTGFAAYYPTINTIFLLGVEANQAVKRLSSLKSIGPLAGAIGAGVILLLMSKGSYFSKLAVIGFAVILVGILCISTLPSSEYAKKQHRLRLKKKLLPYYLLNFLNGCRSAIFSTFVIYYLITEMNFKLGATATIVLTGNVLTFAGYQYIGRLARRFDPANLLAVLYLVMCLNFLAFMVIKNEILLSLVFLVDSLVFCTSAITDSYPKIMSDGRELLGDLAVGVSLYHLGKVIMPLIGGLLYSRNNVEAFFFGSLCTLFAIFATRKLTWTSLAR
jgi:hypothetical protein